MPVMAPPKNALAGLLEAVANTRKPQGFSGMPVSDTYGPQQQTLDELNRQHPEGVLTTPGQASNRWGDDAVFKLIQTMLGSSGDPALDAMDIVGPIGMAKQAGKPLRRVFQGSPHKIPPEPGYPMGRFKDEFLGTGEGNMAFGKGHYQAEAQGVAETYRSGGGMFTQADAKNIYLDGKWAKHTDTDTPEGLALSVVNDPIVGKDIKEKIKTLKGAGLNSRDRHLLEAGEWLEKNQHRIEIKKGNVYESELKAPDEDFLDFDKPISEQSKKVQKVIGGLESGDEKHFLSWLGENYPSMRDDWGGLTTGQQSMVMTDYTRSTGNRPPLTVGGVRDKDSGERIYRALSLELGGDDAATEFLQSKGIRGIRFLDGFSREGRKGTSNFVVFDPKDLEILKVLGLAGVAYEGSELANE